MTLISFLPTARRVGAIVLALLAAPPLLAAPAAESIFPQHTVLWFSLPDAPAFQEQLKQTQLGLLAQDESLAPFAKHLREQAMDRFGNLRASLGVSLDDVITATGGEFAMGVAHQQGQRAATIVTIDPTGKRAEADALVAEIDRELTAQGAQSKTETLAGLSATVYQLPKKDNHQVTREELVRFETGGLLCYVESRQQAQALIMRINGGGDENLTGQEEFSATMRRCQQEGAGTPHARWFFSPFKYDMACRSRQAKKVLADKEDTFTILRKQGFDAIRGVGGHVHMAVDPVKDFVHYTSVYAPPKPGTAGKTAAEKYDLGMRMAEMPNSDDLTVQKWAPRDAANYSTFSIDVQNAFDNFESVFNAMAGVKNGFQNTLDGFERDPYGPKIKVRQELIANLSDRVTRVSDYNLPVSTDCERFLFVFETKNAAALKTPVDKWMESDGAEPRELRGVKYWEIVPEEELDINLDLGGGLIPLDDEVADEEESLLRHAAVCVHNDVLIVASDVEYLEQVLFGVPAYDSLSGSHDFMATMNELNQLADLDRCGWAFIRNDESMRPTYELLRQGKLPEGQTFFARLLNKLLTTAEDEEKGIVRKQRVNASRLPSFEMARRYFGPSARAVKTEDDGWFITGVVLNKAGG